MTKLRMLAHGLISLTLVCAVGSGCRSEGPAHNLAKTSYQKPKTQRNGVPAAPAPLSWEDAASTYDRLGAYACLDEKEKLAISKGEPQAMRLAFRK